MLKTTRLRRLPLNWFLVICACTTMTLLAACGGGGEEQTGARTPAQRLSGRITVDGSSTVFPITEAVAEEFQKKHRNVRVTVGISGTGGGFKKFCAREIDISDASRPIEQREIDECRKNGIDFIEVPVAYDGLSVLVNPRNTWVDQMTVEELKRIWEPDAQGRIMRWNQVRTNWPDEPLRLYGPGTDSGTFDYFTQAIVGKEKASRGDYTASEDDNVLVQGIAGDRNALGYFGYAYYVENKDKLKLVPIVNPKTGRAVLPSEQTIASGEYFPLSRPIFLYVSRAAAERPEVQEFVRFYLTEGRKLVSEVGYLQLPANVYDLTLRRFENRTTGTMFGPGSTGKTLEQLLSEP